MKMKAGRDNFSSCFAAFVRLAQWKRIVLVGVVTLLLVGHAQAQAPSIAGITPNTGGVGEYMAISGSNFGATQGTSTVTFNGTPATVVNSWSNTHIATYVPSGATTGHIVVTVGGVSSATTQYDIFTVITTPYISGLAGNSGPVGSVFTVNGSNFGASQGTSTLTINGTPVTQYHYWTNNQIGAAVVPSGATTGYVVVTVNGASSPTNQYVIYTVTPTVYYYFDDALGSSRVITNSSGTICYDADFYPFGGERPYTNTCTQNYKFTGKERDSESGLDDFGARFFSSQYGRFMSADPGEEGGFDNEDDPQAWNGYAYARNNPLVYADPSGLSYTVCIKDTDGTQHCTTYNNDSDFYQAVHDSPGASFDQGNSGNIYANGQVVGTFTHSGGNSDTIETNDVSSDFLNLYFAGEAARGAVALGRLGYAALAGAGREAAADAATTGTQQALAKTVNISDHAAKAMAEHNVSQKMVEKALEVGQRFYDPKNNSVVYVVKEGMASGKDLAIATDKVTGVVKTVMVNVETIRPRFIPMN